MGCVSHGGASVLMGGFKKNRRMGVGGGGVGGGHLTMGNPLYGKFYADNG